MRKTKIVCTIGPASAGLETLVQMIRAGMNVARINFSHGDYKAHEKTLKLVREASALAKTPVAVLGDLSGPKIRIGDIEAGSMKLEEGAEIVIEEGSAPGGNGRITSTYGHLVEDLKIGDRVLLDDGMLELVVMEKQGGTHVKCRVVHGGTLLPHKGINLPGVAISSPSLTEKDKRDLGWILERDFDYVALSFVRDSADVRGLRKILHKASSHLKVVSKIEKPEALADIEEILKETDAVMVARGDLGVEMLPHELPAIQKDLIRKCNEQDIPVITATQMLESMRTSPRPTRAEVSDVANAIFDGTDAIMLSGETATGDYPVLSVAMMHRIAEAAESYIEIHGEKIHTKVSSLHTQADAICHSAHQAAHDMSAKAIAVLTLSGSTALLMSKYHPVVPVLGFTFEEKSVRRMCLYRGVVPVKLPRNEDFNVINRDVEQEVMHGGFANQGDVIVIITGQPLGYAGGTNAMKVHRVEFPEVTRTFKPEAEGVECVKGKNYTAYLKTRPCFRCGLCVRVCPSGVFEIEGDEIRIVEGALDDCLGDMACVNECPVQAIRIEEKS
ncbi:MAG: pyruvate kinase [Planctomycetota bacterium]